MAYASYRRQAYMNGKEGVKLRTVQRTSQADLHRIASERGREYDPKRQAVWCSECSAPLTAFGILHWVDCSGDEGEIRFRDLE